MLLATESSLRERKKTIQTNLSRYQEAQRRYVSYQKELLLREEHRTQRVRLDERRTNLSAELAGVRAQLKSLPDPDSTAQQEHDRLQAEIALAEARLHEHLGLLASAREEHGRSQARHLHAQAQLTAAQEAQRHLASLQQMRHWAEEHFVEIVNMVERHVLASVHAEFQQLFEQWFGRLVGDESITVGLGEHFQPVVTQNGYDAALEQLSGGEKTAVALSYRLSLYRVVSDFISTVRTKELLILDEPTDGFSTEQLDRVREVLRELGCRQIILVSHEPQMETCCDRVVRISKHLHRSSVTSLNS